MGIICLALQLYLYAIFGRIILSWFPLNPGGIVAQVFSFLYAITEPLLGPIRRAIPPIGGAFDVSPIVVLIGAQILIAAIC